MDTKIGSMRQLFSEHHIRIYSYYSNNNNNSNNKTEDLYFSSRTYIDGNVCDVDDGGFRAPPNVAVEVAVRR